MSRADERRAERDAGEALGWPEAAGLWDGGAASAVDVKVVEPAGAAAVAVPVGGTWYGRSGLGPSRGLDMAAMSLPEDKWRRVARGGES